MAQELYEPVQSGQNKHMEIHKGDAGEWVWLIFADLKWGEMQLSIDYVGAMGREGTEACMNVSTIWEGSLMFWPQEQ